MHMTVVVRAQQALRRGKLQRAACYPQPRLPGCWSCCCGRGGHWACDPFCGILCRQGRLRERRLWRGSLLSDTVCWRS